MSTQYFSHYDQMKKPNEEFTESYDPKFGLRREMSVSCVNPFVAPIYD